jgi:hypothetical protein
MRKAPSKYNIRVMGGMSLEEPCEISGDPSRRSAVPAQPRISPARAGSEARRAEFREFE